MRVLITNDDGVEAPGLIALTDAVVAAGHDVVVAAPAGQCSGSGAAIGLLHRSGPIACTEIQWSHLPDVPVFALDLPPAAAVYAGVLGAFGPVPDVVASGMNPGLNCGHLVLHSGTVGAALTAAAMGVPGLAISMAWNAQPRWATGAALVPAALEWTATRDRPMAVSVNVPDVDLDALRGVRDARPAPFLEHWTAARHPGEIVLDFAGRDHDPPPGTDLAFVLAGYAAVTAFAGITPGAETGAAEAIATAMRDYAARS